MRSIAARISVIAVAIASVTRGFDAAYIGFRANHSAVPADSLIHYQWILTWWWHGDSVRGFTLTPSPYFIDLLVQLPIALIAPDFERFGYAMALVFALLIFGSVYLIARIVLGSHTWALAASTLCVIAFYLRGPPSFVVHAFMYNHTSEVYATLGMVALLYALYRPCAPHRLWGTPLYVTLIILNVASSPFFIATYCVPVTLGLATLLGTSYVTWRRLAWFVGITAAAAIGALVGLALFSHYVWPVRGDAYPLTAYESYKKLKHALYIMPGTWRLVYVVAVAMLASGLLAVIGWRRRWDERLRFVLALFPACVIACLVLPIKRGAYGDAYGFRYLQLPWLLGLMFYSGALVIAVRWILRRFLDGRRIAHATAIGVAGSIASVVLVATAHGPYSMQSRPSTTSTTLGCFARAEELGLQDGFAGAWMARYFNSARLSPSWQSSFQVIQVAAGFPLVPDPRENNLVWLAARGARPPRPNFLITHSIPGNLLELTREEVGAPDVVVVCPLPVDMRFDANPSTEIWIWYRPAAIDRLAAMLDTMGPFDPVTGTTRRTFDARWDMGTLPTGGELVEGKRVWRRRDHNIGGAMLWTLPVHFPTGRYRVTVALSASGVGREPIADIVGYVAGREVVRGVITKVGSSSFETELRNFGGPTSGDAVTFNIYPRDADSVEVDSITLELLERGSVDPLRLFK